MKTINDVSVKENSMSNKLCNKYIREIKVDITTWQDKQKQYDYKFIFCPLEKGHTEAHAEYSQTLFNKFGQTGELVL